MFAASADRARSGLGIVNSLSPGRDYAHSFLGASPRVPTTLFFSSVRFYLHSFRTGDYERCRESSPARTSRSIKYAGRRGAVISVSAALFSTLFRLSYTLSHDGIALRTNYFLLRSLLGPFRKGDVAAPDAPSRYFRSPL